MKISRLGEKHIYIYIWSITTFYVLFLGTTTIYFNKKCIGILSLLLIKKLFCFCSERVNNNKNKTKKKGPYVRGLRFIERYLNLKFNLLLFFLLNDLDLGGGVSCKWAVYIKTINAKKIFRILKLDIKIKKFI